MDGLFLFGTGLFLKVEIIVKPGMNYLWGMLDILGDEKSHFCLPVFATSFLLPQRRGAGSRQPGGASQSSF